MDATTAAFLQDSLRGYTPTIPVLPNYLASLKAGFDVANQLDAGAAAANHQAAAEQSLAAAQQQYNYAAQTNPYNAALLQEKVDTLPLDRKYNQDLQAANVDKARAQGRMFDAHAAAYGNAAGNNTGTSALPPLAVPPPDDGSGDGTAADGTPAPAAPAPPAAPAAAAPVDEDLNSPSSLGGISAPVPGTGVPLSLNDTTAPDDDSDDLTSAVPTSRSVPGASDASSVPGVNLDDLVEVHDADNPRGVTWHNGAPTNALPTYPADGSDLPVPDAGMLPGYTPASMDPKGNGSVYMLTSNDARSSDVPGGNFPAAPAAADDASTAASTGAGYTGGFRVPTSDADLAKQRNYFEARAAQARASGTLSKADVKQLATEEQALGHVENVYRQQESAKLRDQSMQLRQTRAAGGTPTTGVLSNDQPPEREGYTLRPTGYVAGKQHWVYVPNDELQDKADARALNKTKSVDTIVKGATDGAEVSDLLADRGDYSDALGKHVPGTHYFMRTLPGIGGSTEASVPDAVYSRLRGMTDPIYYGGNYTGGVPAQPAAAPTVPTTDGFTPIPAGPATPIRLALGANAAVPAARTPQLPDSVIQQAATIRAQAKAGTITRDDAIKQLQAIGFD